MTVTVCAATGAKRLQPANIARIAFFFAYLGGFDTHDLELNDRGTGLAQVSQALNAFYNSTVEMSVSQNVVTFTESDFGRTLQPSGGSTLATVFPILVNFAALPPPTFL